MAQQPREEAILVVQPAGRKNTRSVVSFLSMLCVLLCSGPGFAAEMRKDLQRSYETYKKSALHYKVFALKHEGESWDGWYTWGYDDLDQAILDAVRECNKGTNVAGKCQVHSLGNEVVVGLEPLELQSKIEAYRINGMVERAFPKPVGKTLKGLGLSGDGRYFSGVLPGKGKSRLFIYDTEDELWKHTFVLETDLKLEQGRSFSLSQDGKRYAYNRYVKSTGDKGKSSVVIKGWNEGVLAEIPLLNGAFWNGSCGVALSPAADEVAVCVDDGVMTRIIRYEVATGKKLGGFDSAQLKGKFDQSLQYSADGAFLLVQGGRYQFDWVMKKKGKEAELAWVFNVQTGKLQESLEFLLGPGLRGPEDIRFSSRGHGLIVSTVNSITLYPFQGKKEVFLRQSAPGVKVALSPHGVLAVADEGDLFRYTIAGGELRLIDSAHVGSGQKILGYDATGNRWLLVGAYEISKLPGLSKADLTSLTLSNEAKMMFEKGAFAEGVALLSKSIEETHKLPAGLAIHNFYVKYPDIPLASLGDLYGEHAKKILETSPRGARLGFGYVKDENSGLFFTTVKRIDAGSSVAYSGVEVGDRITHINGTPVVLSRQIYDLLDPLAPGTRVALTYMRQGRIAKTNVVTEVGFKDTGKAAQVLLALFDYGQLAAQAGHPGIARQAAVRLREIGSRYPSSFRIDLIEHVAVSLEALAFAVEGELETGFDLLGQSMPHPFQFRLYNTLVWGDFYTDRHRLAETLGVSDAKLPQNDGVMDRQKQDYPDLNGNIIPAVMVPPLLR